MKILYVHQYFRTPQEGGCTRSYELARGLVEAGHEVTMITGHIGEKEVKNVDGIQVHYLPVGYSHHFSTLRRVYSFLRFVRLAKKEALSLKKHDLAYVMTTPLTTGFIALFLKERLNIPYYFEVGDLWPAAPIAMGVIRNRWIKEKLYAFEKRCYFEADKVIALSPPIRTHVEKISPGTRVQILTNFSDCQLFQSDFTLKKYTAEKPLNIGYLGTFGPANELSYLIEVAAECGKRGLPVHFNLMGDGKQLNRIKQLARPLRNVSFYSYGNKRKVKGVMEKQDAVYISFKNLEVLGTGSPNKLFDGLAAGKLVITNFGGWIASLLKRHKCGFTHHSLHPEEFVRKISVFLRNPELLTTYKRNARGLAESYYDRNLQVEKLLKILNNETRLTISDSEVYILTA